MSRLFVAVLVLFFVFFSSNFRTKDGRCGLDVVLRRHRPVFYEPTDINKAAKPFECAGSAAVAYASPNLAELLRMLPAAAAAGVATPQQLPLDALVGSIDVACRPLLERMHCLLVTLGQRGLLVGRPLPSFVCFFLTPASILFFSFHAMGFLFERNGNNHLEGKSTTKFYRVFIY